MTGHPFCRIGLHSDLHLLCSHHPYGTHCQMLFCHCLSWSHSLGHSLCCLGRHSDPGPHSDPYLDVGRPDTHLGIHPDTGPNRNDLDTLERKEYR